MRALLLAAAVILLAGNARAASWPPAEVTLTVPGSAGSESAAYFSLYKEALAARIGKAPAMRFIPGQAGAEAWAMLADDPPDGSVLTNVLLPNLFLRALQPDSGVYPEGMAVCHIGGYSPCVLWVVSGSPLESIAAFAETARAAPDSLLVGGPGLFSAGQVASLALNRLTGTRAFYVPYAGSAEAAQAAAAKKVAAFWGYAVPPQSPRTAFRALGVAAESRVRSLPGVPTFRELGVELIGGAYFGVAVPGDVPEEFRRNIAEMFSAVAKEPGYISRAVAAGFVPLNLSGREAEDICESQRKAAARDVEEYSLTER